MSKALNGFIFLLLLSTSAKVFAGEAVLSCDLNLFNAQGELDLTLPAEQPAFQKDALLIERKSKEEIQQQDTYTNFSDSSSGCFVHGLIGTKMIYDKKGNLELIVVNPQKFEELCFADNRERLMPFRAPYKVSTHIQIDNLPERFTLLLPTPKGIGTKDINNIKRGENVRSIVLQCHSVK